MSQDESSVSSREREAARLFGLAAELHRQGRLDEAVPAYVQALALGPDLADAYNNLGVIMRSQRKFGAAIACYRRAIALGNPTSGLLSNLGNALRDAGRLEEAIVEHQKAVNMRQDSAPALYNLGLALRDFGQHETAVACFDRALSLRGEYVDCRWDRALTLLQMGRLEEGFAEYEWRWKLPEVTRRSFEAPAWDGGDLGDRTLLLWHEQGFGDMIQFVRCIRSIPRGPDSAVILFCQPELVRLFADVAGLDRVVPGNAAPPPCDVQAPLLSLPWLLGMRDGGTSAAVPYLSAAEDHPFRLPEDPAGRLRVGLVWAGKPTHKNDRNRSSGFTPFVNLLDLPRVAFFSLQKGPRAADVAESASVALVTDLASGIGDFADTAAILAQLDLLIGVDTAVVHLAGALNRPVWTLLPFSCDWRWGVAGETTPWYPSMRLFRQPRPGDWASVFRDLRAELAALAEGVAP